MNSSKTLLYLALFSIVTAPATAGRHLKTLPFSENFDHDNYNDIVWVDNGATHTWVSDKGWKSSGAAKLTPPLREGRAALGQFTGLRELHGNITQLNLRFLIYYGSEYQEHSQLYNKLVIMNRIMPDGSQGVRPMLISRGVGYPSPYETPPSDEWRTYGACDGTVCSYEGGGYRPDGRSDRLRIGDTPHYREQEWISVEFEANTATGEINLYVHTQDGLIRGKIAHTIMQDQTGPGGWFTHIDLIGGYHNGNRKGGHPNSAHPDFYYMIDELKIDTKYIGPPKGFAENSQTVKQN